MFLWVKLVLSCCERWRSKRLHVILPCRIIVLCLPPLSLQVCQGIPPSVLIQDRNKPPRPFLVDELHSDAVRNVSEDDDDEDNKNRSTRLAIISSIVASAVAVVLAGAVALLSWRYYKRRLIRGVVEGEGRRPSFGLPVADAPLHASYSVGSTGASSDSTRKSNGLTKVNKALDSSVI